jgi:hypothetical protein
MRIVAEISFCVYGGESVRRWAGGQAGKWDNARVSHFLTFPLSHPPFTAETTVV